MLDLTHALSPTFPIWPGGVPIKVTNIATVAKAGYFANKWELAEHHGTHLDAPAHFAPKGATAERLSASALVVAAAVIDIRGRARKDADAVVTVDDIKAWEKKHGKLPKGCAVFLNSGWDAKAGDAKEFLAAVKPLVEVGYELGRVLRPTAFDVADSGDFIVADAPGRRPRVSIFESSGKVLNTFSVAASDAPLVVLSTAHPAKFPEAVQAATGLEPSIHARARSLFDRDERIDHLPADAEAVKRYVRQFAATA